MRCGQARLGLTTAHTGMRKSQNGCKTAGLGCSTYWQMLGLSVSHVRLDHSNPRQAQESGLGMGMVGELLALPCKAAAPEIEHESQDCGQARLIMQEHCWHTCVD